MFNQATYNTKQYNSVNIRNIIVNAARTAYITLRQNPSNIALSQNKTRLTMQKTNNAILFSK